MRVSTAALYTFAALVAHDLTSQAIAAPPTPDTTSPDPSSAIAPANQGLTTSELIAPIAPAEAFPIQLAPTETIAVAEKATPATEFTAPVAPPKPSENQPANFVPASIPLTAHPTPEAGSTSVFSISPEVTSAVEQTSVSQSAPLMQTLNGEVLLNEPAQAGNSRLSTQPSKVSVGTLTPAEVKAFQQGLTADRTKATTVTHTPAPTENGTSSPAALVSANLAEAATAAFGENETQANPTAANATANTQAANAANTTAHDANDGFSLSVYNPVDNARSFYNLTTRPPAQLSNGNASLLFPLSIPSAITSAFGWRTHPVLGSARFHAGTDLGAPQGTPVLAALDGKVEVADFVGGYGLTVVLQHTKGTEQTLYAHLSEIFVQPGDTIKQGEAIGRVGSTGLSTGPHLHFEFRKLTQEGWTVMDPGPSLEYALLHFNPSQQVAQADSALKLPNFFKYSGKFLDVVQIASRNTAGKQDPVAMNHTSPLVSVNESSIVTARTRSIATELPRPQ